MATINPETTYPNGAALDITLHNANIYSIVSGRGVMSEPNGGLEQANLVSGFTVRAEHIMTEEAVIARAESLTVPMDIYSNGFGVVDDDDNNYVSVAGLAQRVYIPFDISALVWEWSFFIAAFRPATVYDGVTNPPAIDMRVSIDGVDYPSMRRQTPITTVIDITDVEDHDQVCANWYDFALLQESVAKGFHEFAVKLYMERPIDPATNQATVVKVYGVRFGPEGGDSVDCKLHTRISYGTRSSRAIMFK